MQWLNNLVDEIIKRHPDGEILVSSGVSPSGKYHIGTLREVLTADAVFLALKLRDRSAKHIHFVDDLDYLRKIPRGVPQKFEKYLGQSVCDVPSPDGKASSYADYYLQDFINNVGVLGIDMEVMRSHEKYRDGFFVNAIERTLDQLDKLKKSLEQISGRKLGEEWSPIQVNEDGYLKKRPFVSMDKKEKVIKYLDKEGNQQTTSFAKGEVKLDWRIDWPARWWLLDVDVEPFGRDHAAKGGSYDTGVAIVKDVFGAKPPIPVPYQFINRAGETKKMSKSAGDTVTITELLEVLPPEIVRYFVLRFSPDKQLFFDETVGVIRLIDEYAELLAKSDKSNEDELLLYICAPKGGDTTISNVPFSHLVASYQAALKDVDKTLNIIGRTEHAELAELQTETIKRELKYIDRWLDKWAPEDVKFELVKHVDSSKFSENQQQFLNELAHKIEKAPDDAGGEWYHQAIYDLKDSTGLEPKELFQTLYQALIGKNSGPRAGWFLSILPKDWLLNRLQLIK